MSKSHRPVGCSSAIQQVMGGLVLAVLQLEAVCCDFSGKAAVWRLRGLYLRPETSSQSREVSVEL